MERILAGTKAFDVAEAERALMRAFWQGGYAGTGIGELEASTGLKRGSLYNAFGDKAAMFRVAFARYGTEVEEAMLALLDRDDLVAGAEAMLAALVAGGGPDGPPGCLISRMAGELGGMAGPAGDSVRARLEQSMAHVEQRLSAAVADGTLRQGADVAVLARMLVGSMRAVTLLSGAGAKHAAEDVAAMAAERLRSELA
ncbi:MAG: TetR family transcriptional regulator [Pseudomonadota bacterium]